MTDIHLDTSWCPVCDREIPPKRFTVPIAPPPQPTAIRSSQTTRGKHGTIKGRSGLVQGTGRVRPALNRANSTKGKVPQRDQVLLEEPVRTRTVIDPGPTPLYCSESCRLKDLEDSWPIVLPAAHDAIEAPSRRASRIQLGDHPAQLNPARASPPPPSPTIPPVPPNSLRASRSIGPRPSRELDLDELALCIQEEADEHSDSSSASGTSFTASDRSPTEERDLFDNSNLYTDPQPPPLPPLPLHPHRPSAPVVQPRARRDKEEALGFDRGNMMVAKRLQNLLASGAADDDRTRAEKREREEKQRKEEERLRRWDFTGEFFRSSSNDREKKKQEEPFDPLRWTEVVYQYGATSSSASSASPGIPSTHRRASNTDPSKGIRAPEAPNRSQSALELYAKYPFFARSSSGATRTINKSSASLMTSYAPAYGVTSSLSASGRSSSSGNSDKTAGASVLAAPGMDPELYIGKRLAGPRRPIAKGYEGKLVLPDVLLRPPVQLSSSLPSSAGLPTPTTTSSGMRRSGSEANVTSKKTERSASALGVVREGEEVEGVWHRPEDGSEDSSSVTHSSVSGRSRRSKGKGVERRPPAEIAPGLDYASKGPVYDAVPPLPQNQQRFEEIFEPDSTPEGDEAAPQKDIIRVSALHLRDKEISRRVICEVGRRRGEHEGKTGWWVEKEWEVRAIPERKRLFRFGGGKA